jgi:hypothetical protein
VRPGGHLGRRRRRVPAEEGDRQSRGHGSEQAGQYDVAGGGDEPAGQPAEDGRISRHLISASTRSMTAITVVMPSGQSCGPSRN